MNISDLRIFLSGGAANSDPELSLGGDKSTTKLISQLAEWGGSSAGTDLSSSIAILECVGAETTTDGWVQYYASTKQAKWRTHNGGFFGPLVSLDGVTEAIMFNDVGAYLVINVDSPNLPLVDSGKSLVITNTFNSLFDDISKLESYLGNTDYRCIYVVNTHQTDPAIDVRLWIDTQPNGDDDLSVGMGDPTLVADEGIAPAGVVFTAPTSYATGLALGDITAGSSVAVWLKRVIPQGTTTPVTNDIAKLGLGALV